MIQAGTVISGTHRSEDLLKAFAQELEALVKDRYLLWNNGGRTGCYSNLMEREHTALLQEAHNITETLRIHPASDELLSSLVNDLINAISEYAPVGTYFGTLEGDGSDFGCWSLRDNSYLSTPVAVSRGRVKIWMEKRLDTQASSPLEECLCYDCGRVFLVCGRVFLVSDEDSKLRFLKHDC